MSMRRIIETLCRAIVVGSLCLVGGGCTKDGGKAADDGRIVLLALDVDTQAVDAVDGSLNAEEAALHSLRVYAFVDGRPAGHFFQDGGLTSPFSFMMDMTLYATTTQDVDFYVVANERAMRTPGSSVQLTEHTTEAELRNFSFTQLTTGNGLPMFCNQRVTIDLTVDADDNPQDQAGHEGHTALAQQVSLELARPMGKLGVFAAKPAGESGTLRVTGLTLLRSGLRMLNYLMPQDEATLKEVGTKTTDQSLTVVTDAVTSELAADISSTERNNPANYTPVLAVPFYPFENPWGSSVWNAAGDAEGNVLRIDFEFDGEARSGLVYLPPIKRNHYYAICCLMNNTGKITVSYSVADWTDGDSWDDLEFAYPTSSNPVQPVDGHPMTQPTVYYQADASSRQGTFSVLFTMSAPAGQTWHPTLLDASPTDFEVKVYQGGKEVTDPVAAPDPYTITVRALKPDNVGTSCALGIAYMPTWNPGKSELLLINGTSSADIAWPDSGTDPEIIRITQVDAPGL